jgi:hypothetical protein
VIETVVEAYDYLAASMSSLNFLACDQDAQFASPQALAAHESKPYDSFSANFTHS